MIALHVWIFSVLSVLLLLLLVQVIAVSDSLSRQSQNSSNCNIDEYTSEDHCCKRCPAGTFLQMPCTTPHTQGQCEKCHPGTFTGGPNTLDHCLLCSSCDKDQVIVAECSSTSDQECQCKPHHYSDPNFPELCLPCATCPKGIPVLRECNSTANTVCGTSASSPRNRLVTLGPICLALFLLFVLCIYLLHRSHCCRQLTDRGPPWEPVAV